jgi:hypothetical protein
MEIGPRYGVESNGQGNIRWHVRDINGKKFLFVQEHEGGYRTSDGVHEMYRKVSVQEWVEDRDIKVYDTEKLATAEDGGVDWDNSPLIWTKHTGWWPYPRHEFESYTEL